MRFYFMIALILLVTSLISWLNYRLLAHFFPVYRTLLIKYAFYGMTLTTLLVVLYGWAKRPSVTVDLYSYFVYAVVAWLFGHVLLLLLQPLFYLLQRVFCESQLFASPHSSSSGITRRTFLQNTLATAPLLAFGLSSRGVYNAQATMELQEHSLIMPTLPPALNGFKIGQISDTHLGPYFDLTKLDRAIALLAEQKPDIVVITGDFADDLSLLRPAIERFNDLAPSIPHGIYFCLGNHDYFRDLTRVRNELNNSRIKNLENEHVLIMPGAQPFYLLGVAYPWADMAQSGINVSSTVRQQYFAAANKNIPDNAFKVLIAHHPDALFDGFAARIPLTVAGHTHGGQVVIGSKSLLSNYHYMGGLYQENGVYGYINRGTGHWFPLRLGCPPEVTLFTLRTP